ncbi:hypothetical protein BZG35_05615 [Brevundimonas sp. LM2]|uniref:hypothetical protein n=1 Tax=Brevundimonas sp. LM2 TaxID=1938605 RepID=UPI000983F36F|nr:hypothetical protein [Brevundimonas sp. LM2]AQR61187.1 hypothetical protein BZG35_05615 [Brevundimonas sp. LM2]
MIPSKVLYFAFDASDSSVIRRFKQLKAVGASVVGLTFRRKRYNQDYQPEWDNIHLGNLQDGHYARRLMVMIGSFVMMVRARRKLVDAELIMARNLDLLLLALAGRFVGLYKCPIVYDVFDVRSVLLRQSLPAKIMRGVERWALGQCRLLIVTSPGFLNEYFRPYLQYDGPALLLENKIVLDMLPAEPGLRTKWASPERTKAGLPDGRLVLGWVGALRCARSAELLAQIAEALPEVTVRISGVPTYCPLPEFLARYDGISNVVYTGEYAFPTGLYDVYDKIDLNWCFDLSKYSESGKWLLPNRLYEGGYFGVPQLSETGSETAIYADRLGIGWAREADAEVLIRFLRQEVRKDYARVKANCVAVMDSRFQYNDDIRQVFEAIA